MKKKCLIGAAAAAVSAVLAGCATTSGPSAGSGGVAVPSSLSAAAGQFAAGQPEQLRPFFRALYIEGEHDAVLNFDYLGLAALETGHYRIAARALDAAITRIEAIYANNPSAQKAKSLFAAEKVKDFKGEPYERAMTYFYRGLLYARTGDYENARASFLAAEEQSMMSESESYQNTFGLMDFLAGWASHCDGDDARAQDLGARAAKVQPKPFASLDDRADYVALADVGIGPVKYAAGKYQEKLAFRPENQAPIPTFSLGASGATLGTTYLGANIDYQAETRGGRPVDAILHGKAIWKGSTSTASSMLTSAGAVATMEGALTGNNGLQEGGEIGWAVGFVGGLFSRAMTAKADTRAWESLPEAIEIATGSINGDATPTLSAGASTNMNVTPLNTRAGRCAISWTKSPALLARAFGQVGSPEPDESQHVAENRALRGFLETTFPAAEASRTAQTAQAGAGSQGRQ